MTHPFSGSSLQRAFVAGVSSLGLMAGMAQADQVFNDDVIITQSLCVGNDCVNGEAFSFDTLRLKENNTRIKFDDTSVSASFPRNDWQLTANDSANGGANKFSIDDITGSLTPFTIEAGARANALYVESDGDVGIGTANPVVEIHAVRGDSPTLRLEQDGSSGFTPQTWDLAGNETNFFVRDVTNGSRLPFRIRPAAPSDSIVVAADGNIGLGTSSPQKDFHLYRTTGAVEAELESTDGSPVLLRLQTTHATNRRVVGLSADTTVQSSIHLADNSLGFYGTDYSTPLATIDSNGIHVAGTQLNVPDYVFDDSYDLKPLNEVRAFIDANHHLPDIASAAEVAKGGLNMTAMQMALLRKVEELTLYTLAQQNEIDALTAQLETSIN